MNPAPAPPSLALQSPGPPEACLLVLRVPLCSALYVVLKGGLAALSLAPTHLSGWGVLGLVVIRPNVLLCVVGCGAAFLGGSNRSLSSFPSLGECHGSSLGDDKSTSPPAAPTHATLSGSASGDGATAGVANNGRFACKGVFRF